MDNCIQMLDYDTTNLSDFYYSATTCVNWFDELEKRLQRKPFPGYEAALEDFIREQRKAEEENFCQNQD